MPVNLEFKAIYPDLKKAEQIARSLTRRPRVILHQIDSYFEITKGRLKIRELDQHHSELIYYERVNRKGSKFSDFVVVPLRSPSAGKYLCNKLFRKSIVVRKKRIVYLFQNSRIHIDDVQDLGQFVEFEVLVKKGRAQARALMKRLIGQFEVLPHHVVEGSYSDLLMAKSKRMRKSNGSQSLKGTSITA